MNGSLVAAVTHALEWSVAYKAAAFICAIDASLWMWILRWYLKQLPIWQRYHAEIRIAADEAKLKYRRRAAAGQRPF